MQKSGRRSPLQVTIVSLKMPNCGQIYFTLFCCECTFVKIYALFWVKQFWLKPCSFKQIVCYQSIHFVPTTKEPVFQQDGASKKKYHSNSSTLVCQLIMVIEGQQYKIPINKADNLKLRYKGSFLVRGKVDNF